MKQTLIQAFNSQNLSERFRNLPRRVFLDTNVLQYLQDFGEFIFDHYRENEKYLLGPRGKEITKDNRLYREVLALEKIFLGIDRTNIEFSLSEAVFKEVIDKKDSAFYRWFCDVWDHWQGVLAEYRESPFSKEAQERHEKACPDKSLLGNLSKRDREIVLDSIRFDCDALLTVDRFGDKNKQSFVYIKYQLTVLRPTDLFAILKPFQALWL